MFLTIPVASFTLNFVRALFRRQKNREWIRADLPLVTGLGGYIRAGAIFERGLYPGFYY